jgi:hypothetical protein
LAEGLEVFRIELLGRHELPHDGPELVAQFGDAAADEARDAFARAVARSRRCVVKRCAFSENTKPSGVSSRHLAKVL